MKNEGKKLSKLTYMKLKGPPVRIGSFEKTERAIKS